MPRLEPRRPPPPDYYADNLDFLLQEVARRNGDLLGAAEQALIDAWRAATPHARRLLARLITRKGPWIRTDRLDYPEAGDIARALDELRRLGLVEVLPPAPADRILDLFTRAELESLFPHVRAPTKPAWITHCVTRHTDHAIRARVAARYAWLGLPAERALAVCRLLFFGTDRRDLTEFVLQDLGVLRFEAYAIGTHTRAFGDRAEVERYLDCRRLAGWLAENERDARVAAAVRKRLWQPDPSRTVARLRDRLLNRIGYVHERRGEYDEALESYTLATTHPARERRARLLARLGDACGARELIVAALADPWSAAEEDYALRAAGSLAAAARRQPFVVTEAPLDLSEFPAPAGGSIEAHALAELTGAGGSGWHLENHFPLGLAGLVFWEEIFAPVAGAFSHPLQLGPRDLFWPDFASVRAHAIAARVAELGDPGTFRAHLGRTAVAKRGIANHLVRWSAWTPDLVDSLLDLHDSGRLLQLARHVIGDLQRARTGFPDLFIVRAADAFEFVEVKGPTDQLQPAQRTWLRTLGRLGFAARVLQYRR